MKTKVRLGMSFLMVFALLVLLACSSSAPSSGAAVATPDTDAIVWIVAMGLDGAEWVAASFTITKATGLSFPVNAADERNYSNP